MPDQMNPKWKIGRLGIDGRVVLGPMSGYTSPAYRDFMKPFGVALSITEMVSDKGIIYDQEKTTEYLRFPRNHPTGLQLFGGDPEEMAQAAARALSINPDIDMIDLNMGCPVGKITKNGGGSALMRDPVKCAEIVRRVNAAVDVPVTVKIRLGWSRSEMNYMDVIEETVSAGADAVMLHARTRTEKYAGNPDYEPLRGLRDDMSVPLVISGNVYCLDDALTAMETTGADGVMVARGGVGNPFLVTQIDHYLRTGERLPNPTVGQQVDWCLEFSRMLIDEKGEETAVRKLRSYAPRFISGCRYGREYRNAIATESWTFADMERILRSIAEKRGDEVIECRRGLHDRLEDDF